MNRLHLLVVIALFVASLPGRVIAQDWASFRGPSGNGLAEGLSAPTKWSGNKPLWKLDLPRPGNGSPIAVGGLIFVTSAEDNDGKTRTLYCVDAQTGKQKWKQSGAIDRRLPTHKTNPYCGTTPVSDGKRVVVWHGSAGLHCYDLSGKRLWKKDLGEFRHQWGYGTSPVIHQNHVILHSGPGESIFLAAFNINDGAQIWKTEESQDGDGQKNSNGKYMGSWCTPVIVDVNGQEQLICMMPTRVNGYNVADGKLVWTCNGVSHERGDLAYSSPIIAGKNCFVTGGFRGPAMAFKLGGTGDITKTNRLWRNENQPQSIGTGIYADGHIFRPNAGPGAIQCIDPKTGKEKWQTRSGSIWGSIVKIGKYAYVTNQDGVTIVFEPSAKEYKEVARNRLNDTCNATPAVAAGRIYLRGAKALYCFETTVACILIENVEFRSIWVHVGAYGLILVL